MRDRKHRQYRQSDALHDLMGRLAADLGTNRTTLIELAVHDLAGRLDGDREALAGRARVIDSERLMAGAEAWREARTRHGMARRRAPEGARP